MGLDLETPGNGGLGLEDKKVTIGGSATVNLKDTADNLLDTVSAVAGSTEELTAPDATAVLKDSDDVVISTTAIKSNESKGIAAPDAGVKLITTGGNVIETVTAKSNEIKNHTVGDSRATVNGNAFASEEHGTVIEVPVQYENGTAVGIIDNGIVKVPDPIAPTPIASMTLTAYSDAGHTTVVTSGVYEGTVYLVAAFTNLVPTSVTFSFDGNTKKIVTQASGEYTWTVDVTGTIAITASATDGSTGTAILSTLTFTVPITLESIFGDDLYEDWNFDDASSLSLTGSLIDSITSKGGLKVTIVCKNLKVGGVGVFNS